MGLTISNPSFWVSMLVFGSVLPSLKLTARTLQDGIPKGNDRLPTINFQMRTAFFMEGITLKIPIESWWDWYIYLH